jgi:acetyl esterase/lipase
VLKQLQTMTKGQPYLDPPNQELIDSLPDGPPLEELSLKQFRAFADSLGQSTQLPGVKRRSMVVPVEGGVPTWIYTPEGSSEDLPFIFYIHGGLWQGGRYLNSPLTNMRIA